MWASDRRPRLAVVFGQGVRPILWTDDVRGILTGFADVDEVDPDPDLPHAARSAAVDAALADADALLLCGWYDAGTGYLSGSRLARAPRLRFIGSSASDRHAQFLDIDAARAAGIAISDTSRVMAPWVAEYELALTLAALRRIPQEHEIVGRGGWVSYRDVAPETERLQGRRVGLSSFGAIHRHLVRLLAPFEVSWQANDPYVADEVIVAAGGGPASDLVAMASRSDVLCVATPPNARTRGLISRAVIEAIPAGGVVVIVSRLAVVDHAALVERTRRGELRVATDVYEPEPPAADDPLRRLPGVVHTPHRAGGTIGAHRAVFRETCEEARRFFSGAELRYPLRLDLVRLVARSEQLPD